MSKYIGVLSITPSEVYASKNEEKSKKKSKIKDLTVTNCKEEKLVLSLHYITKSS